MRLRLIVNPTASSVTPAVQAAVVDALSVRHDVEVAETRSRNHASELAREAAGDGTDVVVVLAGDGTLNEATQALVGSGTALAVLPGGSTNVLARTLGVAYDPYDACAQLLPALDAPRRMRVGVGVADSGERERAFLFHLGVGFDAAVVREMEQRHAHLKRRYAHPVFAVAAVDTWLRRYDRTTHITVAATGRGEGEATRAIGPYAVVSNSDPYTYVGRRRLSIAPDASLHRALAVTVLDSLRATLVLRATASAAARSRFMTASRDVIQLADVWHARVSSDRPFPWQVDGDYLGDVTQLQVRYRPDCLTIVVPRVPGARQPARR